MHLIAKALIGSVLVLSASGTDPYASLSATQRALLQPYVDRWIHDELKHNWADLWEITDQTEEMKNELLLGNRTAPDMTREQFVETMRETIGTGFPELKAFRLTEVRIERDGFWILGCGAQQRETWHQTSVTDVHVRMINGKPRFGLHGGSPEPCKL